MPEWSESKEKRLLSPRLAALAKGAEPCADGQFFVGLYNNHCSAIEQYNLCVDFIHCKIQQ